MEYYRQVQNLFLIVQPGDSFFPLVSAIDSARHTIKMTIFRMDDPIVRGALAAAVARKIKVQALIAPSSKGWNRRNKKLTEELARMGVEVRAPKARGERIVRYHYKIIMVDDQQSLILTFNPTQKNLHYARDFGLLIRDHKITTELNRLFDADWEGIPFQPNDMPLVISPSNSREKLFELLRSATRTIRIMDAKLTDQEMVGMLSRKASSGCDVRVISGDNAYDGVVANFQVRKLARYKLHAKCVVVDGARFFIGSQNLRKQSLDRRREVGMLVEDPALARRIERIFDEDWLNATASQPDVSLAPLGGAS